MTTVRFLTLCKSIVDISRNLLVSLPYDIVKLAILENLQVHRNKLTAFPAGMSELLSLKCLNAEFNYLHSIGSQFEKLPKLTDLNLNHNPNLDISNMPVQTKRLFDLRIIMSSKELRHGIIQRTLGIRKEVLNKEQMKLFGPAKTLRDEITKRRANVQVKMGDSDD